ncbi:MAG: CC_3452 family protein [Caulobacter sp.]
MRTAIFAGLLACALVSPAFAADTEGASLKLKTAPTTESFIHDGSAWRCVGDTCTTAKARSLPAARACRKLAAQVGELTAFTYRGAAIEGEALAECNTAAKKG